MNNDEDNSLFSKSISTSAAKKVLEIMFKTGESHEVIIDRLDLWLLSEEEVCLEAHLIVCDNPDVALKYLEGNAKIINSLVGKVMGKINGRSHGPWVEECINASINFVYGPVMHLFPLKPV